MSDQVNTVYSQAIYGTGGPAATPTEASKILAQIEAALQGGIGSVLRQNAVNLFLSTYDNPKRHCWSGTGMWDYGKEDAREFHLASFIGESYPNSPRSNKISTYMLAACGIKTYEADKSDEINKDTDIVNVFQIVKDMLAPLFDKDGPIQHLSQFGTVEEQNQALALRSKGEVPYGFACKMCSNINAMQVYCAKAGLNVGSDPCYNITRQWEATSDERNPPTFVPGHWEKTGTEAGEQWVPDSWDPGGYKYRCDSPGYANALWSKAELDHHRSVNAPYNPFDINITTQVKSFFDSLANF